MIIQADASNLPLQDDSVDLVFGSPPYCEARTYGIDAGRKCEDWISWMLDVTKEGLRISVGPVLWVVAGTGNYNPACEGLVYRAYQAGIQVLRPPIWTKNAPPTGRGWFSNEWEFVLAFCKKKPLPFFDGEAIGTPLKNGIH